MAPATADETNYRSDAVMQSPLLVREASYAQIASVQYGLITSRQVLELGISRSSISRRLRTEALLRVLPGIHRLAGVSRSWHQRVLAVHFWAGQDSVIAGPAAAALHRLDGFPQCASIDIATPRCLRPPAPWVVVRRPRSFSTRDRTQIDHIPVMTCARTLIDISNSATEAQLELALEDARRRNLVTPKLLEESTARTQRAVSRAHLAYSAVRSSRSRCCRTPPISPESRVPNLAPSRSASATYVAS